MINFLANKRNTTGSLSLNENDALNLACEIEGNPLPDGYLKFKEASYIRMKNNEVEVNTFNLSKQSSSNFQLITQIYVMCIDAGLYTCTGWNTLHNGSRTQSTSDLTLAVKCKLS